MFPWTLTTPSGQAPHLIPIFVFLRTPTRRASHKTLRNPHCFFPKDVVSLLTHRHRRKWTSSLCSSLLLTHRPMAIEVEAPISHPNKLQTLSYNTRPIKHWKIDLKRPFAASRAAIVRASSHTDPQASHIRGPLVYKSILYNSVSVIKDRVSYT